MILCVLIAFSANDWDVQSTIFPEDPQKTVERILPFGADSQAEFFEVVAYELSEDKSNILIEIMVHSPLAVPIKIEDFSAEVDFGDGISLLTLVNEIEVPANGSESLTLNCPVPKTLVSPESASEISPTFHNMSIKLVVEGIEMEVVSNG